MLHVQDALTRCDPGTQFVLIDRFSDEIIGTAIQSMSNFGLFTFGRQQDKIGIAILAEFPKGMAKFWTCHTRHHPVTYDQIRQVFFS